MDMENRAKKAALRPHGRVGEPGFLPGGPANRQISLGACEQQKRAAVGGKVGYLFCDGNRLRLPASLAVEAIEAEARRGIKSRVRRYYDTSDVAEIDAFGESGVEVDGIAANDAENAGIAVDQRG